MADRYRIQDRIADAAVGYLAALLFVSLDDDGNPLDGGGFAVTDIEYGSIIAATADVAAFTHVMRTRQATWWNQYFLDGGKFSTESQAASQLGHDFAMTRRREGVGFWERDHGESKDLADLLCEVAHQFSEDACLTATAGGALVYDQ